MSDKAANKWAVFVSILVRDDSKKENDDAPLAVRDYVTVVSAQVARVACWNAVETLWQEAMKQKELRPVCGARAIPYDEYLKLKKEHEAAFEEEVKQEEPATEESPKPEDAPDGIPSV